MAQRRTGVLPLLLLVPVLLNACSSAPEAPAAAVGATLIGDDIARDIPKGYRECRKLLDAAAGRLDPGTFAEHGNVAIVATIDGYTMNDETRHAKGGFVGVIFAKDGGGSAEYNVMGADTSCVWVGRSDRQHDGPPELTYQLRSLVVHAATKDNPQDRMKLFGVVRSIHTLQHTRPMAFWTENWSADPSWIHHLELTTFNYQLTLENDTVSTASVVPDSTRRSVKDSAFVLGLSAQILAPGPWFTCTPYGCCKIQQ